MKLEVAEERGIGGIFIRPLYVPRALGMRPMPFTAFSTCASLITIPRREDEYDKIGKMHRRLRLLLLLLGVSAFSSQDIGSRFGTTTSPLLLS